MHRSNNRVQFPKRPPLFLFFTCSHVEKEIFGFYLFIYLLPGKLVKKSDKSSWWILFIYLFGGGGVLGWIFVHVHKKDNIKIKADPGPQCTFSWKIEVIGYTSLSAFPPVRPVTHTWTAHLPPIFHYWWWCCLLRKECFFYGSLPPHWLYFLGFTM